MATRNSNARTRQSTPAKAGHTPKATPIRPQVGWVVADAERGCRGVLVAVTPQAGVYRSTEDGTLTAQVWPMLSIPLADEGDTPVDLPAPDAIPSGQDLARPGMRVQIALECGDIESGTILSACEHGAIVKLDTPHNHAWADGMSGAAWDRIELDTIQTTGDQEDGADIEAA